MQINAYIFFDGQCEEAIRFYEKTLGAKTGPISRYRDMPGDNPIPDDFRNRVMHATMTIGDSVVMASDAGPGRFQTPQGFSLCIAVTDPAEAERYFNGLSANARTITMPLQKTFWSEKFGMLVDQFGIEWMVNCAPAA
jgi:PhnB protein